MGIAVFPAAGGGVKQYVQVFTSTGTWTAPSGCNAVELFLVGGGGGAGCAVTTGTNAHEGGGGGGGGEVLKTFISVTPGTTYTVTIGSGGSGATSSGAAGSVGSDSTFGALATAQGGGGGWGVSMVSSAYTAGADRATQGSWPIDNQVFGSYMSAAGGAGGPGQFVGAIGTSTTYGRIHTYVSNIGTTLRTNGYRSINSSSSTPNQQASVQGGAGIDGFGGGGTTVGFTQTTVNGGIVVSNAISGAGAAPAVCTPSTGTINGQNAPANRGGGGGGGGTSTSVGTMTGGNGGSGYAKIIWWA